MSNYKKYVLLLIGISFLIKLIIAQLIGLGNDEVYYWTYALHLDWNYFDHPPFVAWLIRATTLNLSLHQELFVRFGALLSSGLSTWLIFQIVSIIKDERTGWYAALLFTTSIYSSIIAGLFILPDSPQALFWFWGILLLVKLVQNDSKDDPSSSIKWWLWFGLTSGLCILCKIHGAFLWLGVGFYAVLFAHSWLRNPWMYLGGVVTLVLASPIIIWNFQHDFITYTFHSSRVVLHDHSINFLSFFREIFGQIFYNNPINFFLIWIGVWYVIKNRYSAQQSYIRLLLCCFLPLIFTLLFLALFRDTLPHWSGPAYSGLLILAALRLSAINQDSPRLAPQILRYSFALIIVVLIAGVAVVNFYPGSLSSDKVHIGNGDPTLDMYGWDQFGSQMDSLYRADKASGKLPLNSRLIISKWFPAAHLDYYVSPKTHLSTYALGNPFDLHQYLLTNHFKQPLRQGDCAYFIQPSNAYQDGFPDFFRTYFDEVSEQPILLKQYRGGKVCREFAVFMLKGFKASPSQR